MSGCSNFNSIRILASIITRQIFPDSSVFEYFGRWPRLKLIARQGCIWSCISVLVLNLQVNSCLRGWFNLRNPTGFICSENNCAATEGFWRESLAEDREIVTQWMAWNYSCSNYKLTRGNFPLDPFSRRSCERVFYRSLYFKSSRPTDCWQCWLSIFTFNAVPWAGSFVKIWSLH